MNFLYLLYPCSQWGIRQSKPPHHPHTQKCQAGRSHPPGGRTCRKYSPGSCEFHCSSNSECLWPLRRAQRGRPALCSRCHSLFFSAAAAFSFYGDCNTTIPRKAIRTGKRDSVTLRPTELVGTRGADCFTFRARTVEVHWDGVGATGFAG